MWCFIKELTTHCFSQGSKLFWRTNTVIAKVSFTLVLIDSPDGNVHVPSVLLQEALEEQISNSQSHFLLHLFSMLSECWQVIPGLRWCDVLSGKSQKEKTVLLVIWDDTHHNVPESFFCTVIVTFTFPALGLETVIYIYKISPRLIIYFNYFTTFFWSN